MSDSHSTVRVAIVGLGMGANHIPEFRKHPRAQIVALCDNDAAKVDWMKSQHGIERGFTSIDELIDWGGFDLASLALPNDLHEPVTVRFLQEGYHVLAEKPLALNVEGARRIVETARKSGRQVAVHYNQRMAPEHQVIQRAVDAGDLGEIYHVRTGWLRKKGIPIGAAGWFVKQDRAGGGPLIDIGVHMLDAALSACGFPKVLAVTGQTHARFAETDFPGGGMDVEDFATAYIRCENGLTISLEVSWASFAEHYQEAFLHLYGTEAGAHRRTFYDENWNADTTLKFSRRLHGATTTETVDVLPPDTKSVQEDLVDAILQDREPRCTVEQGLAAMEILAAIYESSRTGREVRLDGA